MTSANITVSEPRLAPRELDLSPIVIPPRSRLISLKPFGLESSAVESHWGYLQRLARAHAVRFLDLLLDVGAPFVSHSKGGPRLGQWKHEVSAINGATIGYALAQMFQKLTGRSDLVGLTLHALNSVPGLSVVSRLNHAWCPWCLAEDKEPYDRLLWTIPEVTHCLHHERRLQTHCVECGRPARLFSTRSSVTHCDHCGCSKQVPPAAREGDAGPGDFELWQCREVADLMNSIAKGTAAVRQFEPRTHNLRTSSSLPQIRGITGLARELGLARSTPWGWLHHGRTIQLKSALRWAWVTSTTLQQLFFERLSPDDLKFRALPQQVASCRSRAHRPSVPTDSTALYLTALKSAYENPFLAPTIPALERASGVHMKHAAFKDVHFVRLISSLRDRERRFLHKERVWREVIDVHTAANKVAGQYRTMSRNRVASEMAKPGSFRGLICRKYLNWYKRRLAAGDSSVRQPKKVPLDVRAYWDLQRERSGA